MNSVQQRFLVFCFFVAVIIMGVAMLVVRSMSGGATTAQTADPKNKGININAEKAAGFTERLGVDDNSAIAFLYGADMQGSLDVCG